MEGFSGCGEGWEQGTEAWRKCLPASLLSKTKAGKRSAGGCKVHVLRLERLSTLFLTSALW